MKSLRQPIQVSEPGGNAGEFALVRCNVIEFCQNLFRQIAETDVILSPTLFGDSHDLRLG